MREMKNLYVACLVAGFVLATQSCNNFDDAYQECLRVGYCVADGGDSPDGGDGGQGSDGGQGGDGGRWDAGVDPGCQDAGFDLPDDNFVDSNCDGVDGTAAAAIFVHPDGGSSNTGSISAPVNTISRALQLANNNTSIQAIYIAEGIYRESSLVLRRNVSLHGGYTYNDRWGRQPVKPTIEVVDGGVALTVADAGVSDAGMTIEWLLIQAPEGRNAGDPSIALRVLRSGVVRLRKLELSAARGADGFTGTAPGQASAGAPGQPGTSGDFDPLGGSLTATAGRGGAPGTTGGLSGGTGGRGGGPASVGGSIVAATDGGPGEPDAAGGAASTQGVPNNGDCSGPPASDGQSGSMGRDGGVGDGGGGLGRLQGDIWMADFGSDGTPGGPGGGGGGGGGGERCAVGPTNAYGGGGGGGGSGGAGGQGGRGGGGGGASIGLLIVGGSVSLEGDVVIVTSTGGTGGLGTIGGQGGAGGMGAAGGTGGSNPPGTVVGSRGGRGGDGGMGGPGGPGGGGGGGPSIGIWCGPSSTVTGLDGGVSVQLGSAGFPATGQGGPGAAGVAASVWECSTVP